jgi:hypothetical protein
LILFLLTYITIDYNELKERARGPGDGWRSKVAAIRDGGQGALAACEPTSSKAADVFFFY